MQIQRPAVMDSLQELIGFVTRIAEKRDFPLGRVREIELAVEETLVNILTYAYPQASGDVRIRCEEEGPLLVVTFTDHGEPFDPLSLPPPNLSAELTERKIGGLGIYFVRRMAEHISYCRTGDTNELTLSFGRAAPAVST